MEIAEELLADPANESVARLPSGYHPNTVATQWKPGQSGNPDGKRVSSRVSLIFENQATAAVPERVAVPITPDLYFDADRERKKNE